MEKSETVSKNDSSARINVYGEYEERKAISGDF